MEKRELGRGLAALIPETFVEETGSQVKEIPVHQIVPNPYQPRTLFDPLKMEELVTSVKEHGILQPVLVRRAGHERFQLVAGERRFRAAQAAGLASVPALMREFTEQEQLEIAVVENLQREDIGALEAAHAYRRLMTEFSLTQEVVAQRVGKSRPAIANTLRLLNLPLEIQESLERGEISEGHATVLLSVRSEESMLRYWQIVMKRSLSVNDTKKLLKGTSSGSDSASSATLTTFSGDAPANKSGQSRGDSNTLRLDPNEADVATRLQEVMGTKVTLRRNPGGGGKIEIDFYSAQDLDRIVEYLLYR